MTILAFWHIQCLHLMYAEVAWVLVSSGTQVQPQVILDPDYLPDYLFVSYDYVNTHVPSGWCVHSTFAYGDVSDPLKCIEARTV